MGCRGLCPVRKRRRRCDRRRLLRFSLLIPTPALLIVWAAAAWFRRRIGEGGYWQFLGLGRAGFGRCGGGDEDIDQMSDAAIESDSIGEIMSRRTPAGRRRSVRSRISLRRARADADRDRPCARASQAGGGAWVNRRHGLSAEKADADAAAAREVAEGRHDDQFPLVIWQTGSGTQSNMNVNEVIAGRANEMLSGQRGGKIARASQRRRQPQSSNDSLDRDGRGDTGDDAPADARASTGLMDALLAKAKAWDDIVKIGRTHLQDATLLDAGSEFSGYAPACAGRAPEPMSIMPSPGLRRRTGGRTGLVAPAGFAEDIAAELAAITGLGFKSAPNKFEALASHDVAGSTWSASAEDVGSRATGRSP